MGMMDHTVLEIIDVGTQEKLLHESDLTLEKDAFIRWWKRQWNGLNYRLMKSYVDTRNICIL